MIKNIISNEISFYEEFLSQKECDFILEELEFTHWQPSLTYTPDANNVYKDVLTNFRISQTSQQVWFSDDLNAFLNKIEERLQLLFAFDPSHLENWQATNYPIKGKFEYHLDSGYWENHHAGERLLTFLIYLSTPIKGGDTHFRAIDKYVEAKKGRLLVWKNLFDNGDPNHKMIHSGTPLLKGGKITLVTWLRQKKYKI